MQFVLPPDIEDSLHPKIEFEQPPTIEELDEFVIELFLPPMTDVSILAIAQFDLPLAIEYPEDAMQFEEPPATVELQLSVTLLLSPPTIVEYSDVSPGLMTESTNR